MATFTNQATLSYSGGTINSNIATGEIVEVLSVTKTAIIDEYSQGTQTTYAINIVNSGNTAFTGLTLTDNLGAYAFGATTLQPLEYVDSSLKYFVNGDLLASPTVTAGPPLVISGITVPANGVATILYAARTNAFAPTGADGTIENTATVSGNGINNLTATETISARNEPNLTITKSVSPTTVTENGQITYTFLIQNVGNTAATVDDNVVISDTFNPILSNISVSYNGTAWTSPDDYSYNTTMGLFTTNAGSITVPAGTVTQNADTGVWTVDPGVATLTVTGTI